MARAGLFRGLMREIRAARIVTAEVKEKRSLNAMASPTPPPPQYPPANQSYPQTFPGAQSQQQAPPPASGLPSATTAPVTAEPGFFGKLFGRCETAGLSSNHDGQHGHMCAGLKNPASEEAAADIEAGAGDAGATPLDANAMHTADELENHDIMMVSYLDTFKVIGRRFRRSAACSF